MARLAVRDFVTSLAFDGTGQTISVPANANLDLVTTFTLSFWVKLRTYGSAGAKIMEKGTLGSNGSYLIETGTTGKVIFTIPTVANIGGNGTAIPLEKWTHVAIRKVGTAYSFFLNGALDQSTTNASTITPNANTLIIGRRSSTAASALNGKLDDIRIYNGTGLTDAQVSDIYYFGKIQTVNPPAANVQYRLDEGSGTTALDSSGNGNNGTITGATYSTDVPMVARSAAANRTVVQDFKSSLLYPRAGTTATTTVKSGRILQGLSSYTIGAWVKPAVGSGATTAIYCERAAAGNDILKLESVNGTGGVLRMTIRDDAGTLNTIGANAGTGAKDGKWHYAIVTNKAGTIQFYVDGTLVGGGTQTATNTFTDAGMSCRIGSDAADANATWDGGLADVTLFNVALTPDEVMTLSKTGSLVTYNPIGRWKLNEGAGTSATDYSGNGNTGTITGATYTADVPMVERKLVNPNLTKNGGFDFVPPFTAATTTSSRWIDGTAAGSTTNDIFGWGTYSEYSCTFNYDTSTTKTGYASMKIATQTTAPTANHQNSVNQWPVSQTAITAAKYLMPVVAGASYLITGYIKTDSITNNNARGARFNATTYSGDTSGSTSQGATSFVNGTTDWTYYSTVITISAGRSWLSVSPEIRGESGTAWFDKLEIYPVTAETRLAA